MSKSDFFEKPHSHSLAKSEIVSKYFAAWARIMLKQCKVLTYLDLFSGRGEYDDGTPATPLRILDEIHKLPDSHEVLRLLFYEKNIEDAAKLRIVLQSHGVYDLLENKPKVFNKKVDVRLIPSLPKGDCTFCFIDPTGYKGVSLELLQSVVQGWGNDCVFFLSIHGIKRNLQLERQRTSLIPLLGRDGVRKLFELLKQGSDRQEIYLESVQIICTALGRKGYNYTIPFAVPFSHGKLISHFLVFISKHWLGFKIMKEIMSKYSQKDGDGIPNFVLNVQEKQTDFGVTPRSPILVDYLLKRFRGKKLSRKSIYKECHKDGQLFRDKDIKKMLGRMNDNEVITIDCANSQNRITGPPGPKAMVIFPE